jgi:hypothetical protein
MNSMIKGLGLVFGVPLLFGMAYYSYAMATGEKRMKEVCSQIKPGVTLVQLKEFAEVYGLTSPSKDAGVTFLGESRTYGRFTCKVVLEAGVVKSSEYAHAD